MISSRLQNILKNNEINLDRWYTVIGRFLDSIINKDTISKADKNKIGEEAIKLFVALAVSFQEYGNFKDTWSKPALNPSMFGIDIQINSQKIGHSIQIGFEEKGFYLGSYLYYAENIRYMDDGFWREFLKLESFGMLHFEENSYPISKESNKFIKIFKNKNSKLFNFVKHYFLIELYSKDSSDIRDFGVLEILWSYDLQYEDVVQNMAEAFKSLYIINYKLWKVSDLQFKRTLENI